MENSPEQSTESNPAGQKSEMKKWIIIAIVVIAGLSFIKIIFSPENIAENLIEHASEGNYNVDIDRDGSMQVTSEDGDTMNINTGKSATLPDKWPDSIPVLSDAKIEYSASVSDGQGGENLTITYETSDSVSDVVDYYKEELVDGEWVIEVTMATGDGSMISATNEDGDTVVVNAGESESGTTVVITTQVSE